MSDHTITLPGAESDQVSVSIEVRRVHDPLMDYVTCVHVDTFVYDSMP
jgi:hypothetical protein